MSERCYTVMEIDELREACEMRYEFGTTYLPNGGVGRSYLESDLIVAVEEMVRTYMIAGITAVDIRNADKEKAVVREREKQQDE